MDSPDHCIQFSTVNNDVKEHRRNALCLKIGYIKRLFRQIVSIYYEIVPNLTEQNFCFSFYL